MITKLTNTHVTYMGYEFVDGETRPKEYTASISDLFIGWGGSPVTKLNSGGSSLFICAKQPGYTLEIVNPAMVAATTTHTIMGSDIKITLKHDGTSVKSTFNDIYNLINAGALVGYFYVSMAGEGSVVCPTLTKTSMLFDSSKYPLQIRMPYINGCINTYNRIFTTTPLDQRTGAKYKSRCAVNFLGEELKTAGKIHPQVKTEVLAQAIPGDLLPGYPPGDGTL